MTRSMGFPDMTSVQMTCSPGGKAGKKGKASPGALRIAWVRVELTTWRHDRSGQIGADVVGVQKLCKSDESFFVQVTRCHKSSLIAQNDPSSGFLLDQLSACKSRTKRLHCAALQLNTRMRPLLAIEDCKYANSIVLFWIMSTSAECWIVLLDRPHWHLLV